MSSVFSVPHDLKRMFTYQEPQFLGFNCDGGHDVHFAQEIGETSKGTPHKKLLLNAGSKF